MSVIYIKRRAKYVLFYLWKFLLPLLFSSSHFVFCQRHVHQHREPEKSRKFCEPTWKLNFLLPASHSSTLYFTFLIGHCVCTIPWKEMALSCYTAQKSICMKTFCGTCDLDHPISLLYLLVIALSFLWLFFFNDTFSILFVLISWAV